jgi:hypothetical protein
MKYLISEQQLFNIIEKAGRPKLEITPELRQEKIDLARTYGTPVKLIKNNMALYAWIRRNKLLDVVFDKNDIRNKHIEKVVKKAQDNYEDRGDLKKRNKSLYNLLFFYDAMDTAFPYTNYKKYSDDEIIELVKKYKYKGDIAREDPSLYALALRRGILNTIIPDYKVKYSDEELIKMGRQYNTRSELQKENPNLYQNILRRNLIDIIIPSTSNYFLKNLTDNEIIDRAENFESIRVLRKKNRSLYAQILQRNLLDVLNIS